MPDRPYLFYELTNSLCATCLRKVEAKVVFQDDCVYLHKWCPEHRFQKVLISTDVEYYKLSRQTIKPGQMPLKFNTPIKYGCPYDCGLCPDHEQHSCLTLVEITDQCNLTCPVCYSESSPRRVTHRSLEQVEFMLDCVVRNEGQPDVVQISGGEPTIHPDFFAILDMAKARPIKHLMVNTNGVRIAQDADFARRLKDYMPRFELYLQFDSLRPGPLRALRGADLSDVRKRAIERLNEHNISTTLVVMLKKGLNDGEIGEIIEYALKQPCVRGVTFQPIQDAGRVEDFDPARDRLTLGEVRQQILRQHTLFKPSDVIPVPCHPDCLAMAYALKLGDQVVPLTGMIDPQLLLHGEGSTIMYEQNAQIRGELFRLFSTAASPASSAMSLKQLLCCLPLVQAPEHVTYNNIFRIIIMQFLDAHNFDVRSVKKSCVHIVHPDGRIIPFDTFNMFYRDRKEERLKVVRGDGNLVPLTVSAGGKHG
ncbi:MAG: putative Fe-S oxidoreductase [Phycisphaerales bacterium]|nr:putative Fe-S oxidoreductase [Phycisphaerales bacterium]